MALVRLRYWGMIDRMKCSNEVINGRAYMVVESIQVGEISDQRPWGKDS